MSRFDNRHNTLSSAVLRKDYVYICRKRMEEVQRPRKKLSPTHSDEENIGISNAAPNQPKGEATVVT
jgi:hypothetical protein